MVVDKLNEVCEISFALLSCKRLDCPSPPCSPRPLSSSTNHVFLSIRSCLPPQCSLTSALAKTELCLNFKKTGHCAYGDKCYFAHGKSDLRSRPRVATYKSQPCPDPVRSNNKACQYATRCHFCHPGETLRRVGSCPSDQYYDDEYEVAIANEFPGCSFPWGLYI